MNFKKYKVDAYKKIDSLFKKQLFENKNNAAKTIHPIRFSLTCFCAISIVLSFIFCLNFYIYI